MNDELQQETELRRYLLGEMTLEEQVLVEQRLFVDSEYAEREQAVEDDLIDEYLHSDLTAGEREKFESHFLRQPGHGEDLRIAEALKKHLASESAGHLRVAPDEPDLRVKVGSRHLIEARASLQEFEQTVNSIHDNEPAEVLPSPSPDKRMVWWSLAAAALIILSIVAWSLRKPIGNQPLQAGEPGPPKSQPQERQQPGSVAPDNRNTEETAQERDNSNEKANKSVKRQPRATEFATVVIMPGGIPRGVGGGNRVTITDNLQSVILRLPLTLREPYDSYRVELLSGDRTINTWDVSAPETDEKYGPVVSVEVPARRLRERSYKLRLRGVTGQQSSQPTTYSFVVDRK